MFKLFLFALFKTSTRGMCNINEEESRTVKVAGMTFQQSSNSAQ